MILQNRALGNIRELEAGPHVAVSGMSSELGYFEMFWPSQRERSERKGKDEAICRLQSRSRRNNMLKLKMHAVQARSNFTPSKNEPRT